jgi:hypothetical protein
MLPRKEVSIRHFRASRYRDILPLNRRPCQAPGGNQVRTQCTKYAARAVKLFAHPVKRCSATEFGAVRAWKKHHHRARHVEGNRSCSNVFRQVRGAVDSHQGNSWYLQTEASIERSYADSENFSGKPYANRHRDLPRWNNASWLSNPHKRDCRVEHVQLCRWFALDHSSLRRRWKLRRYHQRGSNGSGGRLQSRPDVGQQWCFCNRATGRDSSIFPYLHTDERKHLAGDCDTVRKRPARWRQRDLLPRKRWRPARTRLRSP